MGRVQQHINCTQQYWILAHPCAKLERPYPNAEQQLLEQPGALSDKLM